METAVETASEFPVPPVAEAPSQGWSIAVTSLVCEAGA